MSDYDEMAPNILATLGEDFVHHVYSYSSICSLTSHKVYEAGWTLKRNANYIKRPWWLKMTNIAALTVVQYSVDPSHFTATTASAKTLFGDSK